MAKCSNCQQKISDADFQKGKCSQCGTEILLLSTARPPFDPADADVESPPEAVREDMPSQFRTSKSVPAQSKSVQSAPYLASGTAMPDSIESDIASGTAVSGTSVPPPPAVPPHSSLPDPAVQTSSALPQPTPQAPSSSPAPVIAATTAVPDFDARSTLELDVAAATARPESFAEGATARPESFVESARPDSVAEAEIAAPQPEIAEASSPSRPTVPVSAAPPPPADSADSVDDEKGFDAGHSIKPRQDAHFDQTEIEDSPSDYFEATQIEDNLNATGTIPIPKPTEPIERAKGAKKGDRRKDGEGPETYLVIQQRDVSQPDEFHRDRPNTPIRYDYDVSELIGEGGMGLVYQASQGSLDRDVALKMIKPRGLDETSKRRYTVHEAERVEKAMQKRDREWFLSEAVVTANLEHPYIVPIYDVVKDRKDSLFYAMKWVRGTPWSKLIQEKSKSEGEHLEILQKVSDAVAFAHEKGVIHRDLKPENVMVGNHGEVYVMDWGAALVTPQFERSTNLSQSSSGFGSVLYAAPELFLGSVEQITARSDVYLLGAILFEVISGYAPHPYPRNKSEALQNLRGNQIRPSEYKGELLDIALKAMATDPAARYASVQEFQTAIRDYQSHTVSLQLSTRAQDTLETAQETGDYHDYARAVFAFAEARDMWAGNVQAQDGVGQAKLKYAQAALQKGDFDLGVQTADANDPQHADVIVKLRAAQKDRDNRKQRLKRMTRAVAALVVVMLIGAGIALVLINEQKGIALTNEAEATKQKGIAQENAADAIKQKGIADENAKTAAKNADIADQNAKKAKDEQVKAEANALLAQQNADKAEKQRMIAEENKDRADKNADDALTQKGIAEDNATKAKEETKKAVYEAYVAKIGLVDSKVRTAAFDDARSELKGIETNTSDVAAADAKVDAAEKPEKADAAPKVLRGWEFDRLSYLAGQSQELLGKGVNPGEAQTRDVGVEALALMTDGKRFVAARKDGTFVVGSTGDEKISPPMGDLGKPILAVAVSPDGKLVATAGDWGVQLWTLDGKKVGDPFARNKRTVYSVQFSRRGEKTWLLTAGADTTAQLWDIDGGAPQQPQQTLQGHFGPIRRAIFSDDASLIVTAGDDNRALAWKFNEKEGKYEWKQIAFEIHRSAILAAAIYSIQGEKKAAATHMIVTADEDGHMFVWSPDLLPIRTSAAAKSEKGNKALIPNALARHDKAVHTVAFSSDGKYVVSGSDDNTVRFQRILGATEQHKPDDVQTFRGHGGWVRGCVIGSLMTGSPATGSSAAGLNRRPVNNWYIVSGSYDGTVRRWNVSTYREERVLHDDEVLAATTSPDRDVLAAVFSPDGKKVLTGGRDHKGYLWNVRTGEKQEAATASTAREIQEGHELPIWTAAYAPGGDWLVTAGMDDQALLWNTSTGTQFDRIRGTSAPAAVAVSPDGKWIATSFIKPKDKTKSEKVRLIKSGMPQSGESQPEKPQKLRFFRVDRQDASGVSEALRSDAELVEKQGLNVLAFAPGAKLRLYSGFDHNLASQGGGLVWELKDDGDHPQWVVVKRIPAASDVNGAAFLPDGDRLITAHKDGQIWQHDLLDGETVKSRLLIRLRNSLIRALALHPDGQTLLTLSSVGTKNVEFHEIRRWNLESGGEIEKGKIQLETPNAFTLTVSPRGNEALVYSAAPAPKIDGKSQIVAGESNRKKPGPVVHRYNLEAGKEIARLDSGTSSRQYWGAIYAPSPAGAPQETRILAFHGTRAELLNDQGQEITRSNPHGQVRSVSYSHDGKFFLTAGTDGTIKVWTAGRDATDGKDAVAPAPVCHLIDVHGTGSSSIESAVFSPVLLDGKYQILSAGRDKTAKLWSWGGDAQAPSLVRSFSHDSEVRSAAFSHDAAQIACGCKDGTVWVWESKNEKQPLRKTTRQDGEGDKQGEDSHAIRHIAFANGNNSWIVTASNDNLASVWKNGKELTVHAVLKGHAAAVRSVAFSPKDDRIVTGSDDTFAKVWDPRLDLADAADVQKPYPARELLTLSRHQRPVTTVAFSPNGKIVMTASTDGDTVLWLSKPADEKKGTAEENNGGR